MKCTRKTKGCIKAGKYRGDIIAGKGKGSIIRIIIRKIKRKHNSRKVQGSMIIPKLWTVRYIKLAAPNVIRRGQ